MSVKIINEVIQATAIEQVKDTLLQAQKATGGAIAIGKNIHKGDFEDETFFANFGNIQRRNPDTQTQITPDRLSTLEDSAVKLYFRGDQFVTNTELKRYGTNLKTMNQTIGKQLGVAVARWAIQKGLLSLVGAITSKSELIAGDGSADIETALLNEAMFKIGDQYENITTFVAPSLLTSILMKNAINATADQISYGAVYKAQIGTLGRNLWTVDNTALNWKVDDDNQGHYALGLVKEAIKIDESELIDIITQIDTMNDNAGTNFHIEGAYSINVKGFAYNKTKGINPTDTVLSKDTSWKLIDQIKNSAGVIAKSK